MSEEPKQQIVVRLVEEQEALWRQFANLTNEMNSSNKGYRLFPTLDYHVEGLDDDKMYEMVLEFHQVDDFRYTFYVDQWVNVESSTVPRINANEQAKKIRRGLKTGKEWMSSTFNFDNVRLTNSLTTTNPLFVYLYAMHKYVPILSIYEVSTNYQIDHLTSKPIAVVKFDYTEFIVVRSTYKNPAVKSLKRATNPFSNQRYPDSTSIKRRLSSDEPSTSTKKANLGQDLPITSPKPKEPKLDVTSPATGITPNSAMLTLALNYFTSRFFEMMRTAPYFGGSAGANPDPSPTTSSDSSSANSEKNDNSTPTG